MSERARLLQELAEIHDQYVGEMNDQVEYKPEDSEPHNRVTMESDYNIHHVDRSASPEQEQVFQDRIAHILEALQNLGEDTTEDNFSEKMSKVSTSVVFHLITNGSLVQMLVKQDYDEGLMSYRENGEWVPITPEDDLPALDDGEMHQVIGDATEIWDAKEGQEVGVSSFSSVLLGEEI